MPEEIEASLDKLTGELLFWLRKSSDSLESYKIIKQYLKMAYCVGSDKKRRLEFIEKSNSILKKYRLTDELFNIEPYTNMIPDENTTNKKIDSEYFSAT